MGLGSLLLNIDEAAGRLRGEKGRPNSRSAGEYGGSSAASRAPVREPGAPDPRPQPAPQLADYQESEDPGQAGFAVLWPALGCPGLVDPLDPTLEVLFVSKEEPAAVEGNKEYIGKMLSDILVLAWDDACTPYREDGKPWKVRSIAKCTTLGALLKDGKEGIEFSAKPMDLAAYRSRIENEPIRLGGLLHTMADVVPKAYLAKQFKTIACVRVKLLTTTAAGDFSIESGQMYDLFYGPENGLVRSILDDKDILEMPYEGIPQMSWKDSPRVGGADLVYRWRYDAKEQPDAPRYGDRAREHNVRLFHPFCVVRKGAGEYPNVGHITDLHTSSLWDYFDARTFPDFNLDTQMMVSAPDPTRPQKGGWVPERYNNPNLNVRNLTWTLDAEFERYVDVILQTGDLIDFNRGFNFNPRHDPDKDYLFNLNWIRYYELLLMDYSRPTFTLLGNHERRLNPYPPRIKAEPVHTFLLLYLIAMTGGAGASYGSLFGLLQDKLSEDGSGGKESLQSLILWLIVPIVFFVFLLFLAGPGLSFDIAADILFSGAGLTILFAGGFIFGFLEFLFLFLLDSTGAVPIADAEQGALWGTVFGGSLGFIGSIVALCLIFQERDYMSHITNLRGDDLTSLLDHKNSAYLNAFGKDGLFYMTERSVDWYSLVINPFLDYSFRYGNTFILMGDWWGSEILTADPPVADDVFSKRQWTLIDRLTQWVIAHRGEVPLDKAVVPIFGLHTPVFCPELDANLDDLHTNGSDIGASKVCRGTMEEHRKDLIELFYKLVKGEKSDGKPILAMSLTGHTHDYDVFRMETADKVYWDQYADYSGQTSSHMEKGLHITTTCAGPPSDGKIPKIADAEKRAKLLRLMNDARINGYKSTDKEADYVQGERAARPSGCRILTFDTDSGKIKTIDEISSPLATCGNRDD